MTREEVLTAQVAYLQTRIASLRAQLDMAESRVAAANIARDTLRIRQWERYDRQPVVGFPDQPALGSTPFGTWAGGAA